MTPQIINKRYCFDSLQVRKIAQKIQESPLKDTLINFQSNQIFDLKSLTTNQDSTIKIQKQIIKNDSLSILVIKKEIKINQEINKIEAKEQKKKLRKPLFYSILINIFLGFLIIVK